MVLKVFATVVGVLLAFLTVMGFEWLGHRIWPWPSGLNWKDTAAVAEAIASRPLLSLGWLLLGWIVAQTAGVLACARLHNTPARWPQWCTAGFFLLATCSNFLLLPHPVWFVAVSVISLCASGWALIIFASKKGQP